MVSIASREGVRILEQWGNIFKKDSRLWKIGNFPNKFGKNRSYIYSGQYKVEQKKRV